MKHRNKMIIGITIVALFIAGIVVLPKTAKAAYDEDVLSNGVVYILDETNINFKDYWNENTANRMAPVKKDFVFGGWYQKDGDTYVPVTEQTAKTTETAYAKFVPAYVLSVKAQNEEGTVAGDGHETSVRLISTVDSRSYQNVGFDIWLNNKAQLTGCEATDVYKGLKTLKDSKEITTYPKDEFGEASSHFSVWRLDNIHDDNDSKIIYVRPYWTTMDGTKVYGVAKYVHIEDEYKNYVSIPVNFIDAVKMTAGKCTLEYDSNVLEFYKFEGGRLFAEINGNLSEDGKVKMVGNITRDANGSYNEIVADGIMGSVRFKVLKDDDAKLSISDEQYCNWEEQVLDKLKAFDIIY